MLGDITEKKASELTFKEKLIVNFYDKENKEFKFYKLSEWKVK